MTSAADPIEALELQEFRLHEAGTSGEAARIVAAFAGGIEPAVPLLVSIDDDHDVATVRALHAGEMIDDAGRRAALDGLVETWQPAKRYGPRLTERSALPSSRYRLAVTESGINNPRSDVAPAGGGGAGSGAGATTALGLMWIGAPVGTYAGLMILLGSYDDQPIAPRGKSAWPLPLSSVLGVRVYESQA
jgi:hypothetical protein